MKLLPPDELVPRRLYLVQSRNLRYTIYDGKLGFIGIRTKFGSRFLFTEYHWDAEAYGTVSAMEDKGVDLPEGIALDEQDKELFNFLDAYEKE